MQGIHTYSTALIHRYVQRLSVRRHQIYRCDVATPINVSWDCCTQPWPVSCLHGHGMVDRQHQVGCSPNRTACSSVLSDLTCMRSSRSSTCPTRTASSLLISIYDCYTLSDTQPANSTCTTSLQ
jgi:hypothetical protein